MIASFTTVSGEPGPGQGDRMMCPNDLFTGTADYYARYRPQYPDPLIEDVRDLAPGERGEYLVDWGCGTGEVAIPLSSTFDRVTAVDNDPDMIAVARRKSSEAGISNVDWVAGQAEALAIEPSTCDLITAGSAFHWMDRELLSQRAYTGLKDGAAFALIGGGSSVWDENAEWHSIATTCLRTHLGELRRAGSGTYGVTKRHQDFLVPAGFTVESRDYPTDHSWTIDQIVGYLYSTSFAGPQVLGDRREPFERDLRQALADARPDGVFREQLDFYLIVAHKS